MEEDYDRLSAAIRSRDIVTVKQILESGTCSVKNLPSFPNLENPVIECITKTYGDDAEKCEVLEILVQHGADLNVRNNFRW